MTAIWEHPVPRAPSASGLEVVDTVRALCHDLRQPLAAVLLLAQTPLRGTGEARRRMELIADHAVWIATLVDQVLEAPGQDVVPVDVAACAASAAARAGATAAQPITVSVSGSAMGWAREVALTRALGCLLDNAVRAAGPGPVAVDVIQSGAEVEVLVTDSGPGLGGVPAQTSLGLAITRALVATCGGTLTLRNRPSGGAVARVALSAVEI